MKFWFVVILAISSLQLFGQDLRKCITITKFDEPVSVGEIRALPGSFHLSEPASISYNFIDNTITLSPKSTSRTIEVCFNQLFIEFDGSIQSDVVAVLSKDSSASARTIKNDLPKGKNKYEDIVTAGSISRSLGYGNNNGTSMNSNMDIYAEGKLTDDLKMRAQIRDQNIPYQPEGNSQYLNEYDNIKLEFYNDRSSIRLGDINVQNDSSYFLKYNKQIQGISYGRRDSLLSYNVTIASDKGKSHQVSFMGEEGVQGPYKINGPDSEPFITVIANSEKVYLDGELLIRGEDLDYIIDYNMAEIKFTTRKLITKYSRIIIQFEYLNRNFNSSLKTGYIKKSTKNAEFFTSIYNSKDVLSSALRNMDSRDVDLLLNGGETVIYQNVQFDQSVVSYIQSDTVINGESTKVLKYSENPKLEHFKVQFANVGLNNGSYERLENTSGIYYYVGEMKGSYSPMGNTFSPSELQIVSGGATIDLGNYEKAGFEIAASNNTPNALRASEKNVGYGFKTYLKSDGRNVPFLQKYKVSAIIDFETVDENMTLANPWRSIEFNRNWNQGLSSDKILHSGISIYDDDQNTFGYDNTMRLGDNYYGMLHEVDASKSIGNVKIDGGLYNMQNSFNDMQNDWQRYKIGAVYKGKNMQYKYQYNTDRQVSYLQVDSLVGSLQYFNSHSLLVQNQPKSVIDYGAKYVYRDDWIPTEGEVSLQDYSSNLAAFIRKKWTNNSVRVEGSYRTLNSIIGEEVNTFNGKLQSSNSVLDGLITSNISFETTSGWEPSRDFVYVEVPQGQGHYTWIDSNSDGIKQLDEFMDAIHPDQRNYIRLFVPGNTRVAAHGSNLFSKWTIKMPEQWGRNGLVSNIFKPLRLDIKYLSNSTIQSSEPMERVTSVFMDILDDKMVSGRRLIDSRLKFQPESNGYYVQLSMKETASKNLIFNGFEMRRGTETNISWLFKPWEVGSFEVFTRMAEDVVFSDVIRENDFTIRTNAAGIENSLPVSNKSIIKNDFTIEEKSSISHAVINKFTSSLDQKISKSVSVSISGTYSNIQFEGETNNRLTYTMLEGLNSGNNVIWRADIQKQFKSGIQVVLLYNGRAGDRVSVVHAGQMRFSYRF